jgi:hypothetical protein
MTIIFVLRIVTSDPGYLSTEYLHPLTPEKYAPLRQLRPHNMRHYIKNKLYDFEQHTTTDEENVLIT